MNIDFQNILLIASILLLLGIIASKTTGKLGVPSLLVFLVIGMLAGSDGIGGIEFKDTNIAQFISIVALTFILFSGGLETKYESIRPVLWAGITLSTLGVLLTALSLGLFISYFFNFSFTEGFLIGAIVSSTDAAAVFSILRSKSIGLKGNLRPLLELESGSNDPMAYFLTIGMTSILSNKNISFSYLIPLFFQEMLIGAIMGIIIGKIMLWTLNKIQLDYDGLYPVLILAFILFTFSITTFLHGNGFLAVYLSAIVLGNKNFIRKKSIIRFYDGQAWLTQIVMFITLGLMISPSELLHFVDIGVGISLFLMMVARPLAVWISLMPFQFSIKEKALISWVGLRGAVPIVFATYPLNQGLEKADAIFHIVFFIVISSVLLQGTTIAYMAKVLNLFKPVELKKYYPLELELSDDFKNELFELEIQPNSPAIGKKIFQLNLPKSSLIVLINRNNKYIMPSGPTDVMKGDKLLIMSDNKEDKESIQKIITKGNGT